MKAHFNPYFFILFALQESEHIKYRNYEENDKFYKQSVLELYCQKAGDIPCYVAVDVDENPNAVVGFIATTIPYEIPEWEEADVRKKMPGDKKRNGVFGNIDYLEVVTDYRTKGIGSKLLEHSIHRGETTKKFLAMTVTVLPEDVRAIGLYNRYGFVEVFSDESYYYLARYY
ncbi:hypothetical protein FOL47_000359 [Perkinsus chesapeaki]|uniref:N-acetyltransferase domain-containing protein n=1 Tax=Perkinsus chesapeaki TaxID=330153 RepID=A0A7J6KWJ6_PERCH|nr:hypothetical protein FOL47_000359 [Perkinsus chesapeaki]